MLISAIFEILTLMLLIPFLETLQFAATENISSPNLPSFFQSYSNSISAIQYFISITVLFLLFSAISSIIRMLIIRFNLLTSARIGSELGAVCYSNVINLDFEGFKKLNSSKIISALTTQLELTVLWLNCNFQLILNTIISVVLLIGFFNYGKFLALASILLFLVCYLVISMNLKNILRSNSLTIASLSEKQVQFAQESVGLMRNIKLSNSENLFTSKFYSIDNKLRKKRAQNTFYSIF